MKKLGYQKYCTDLEKHTLPPLNSPTFEKFSISNLEIILPETQGQASGTSIKKENTDSYINCNEGINSNNNTMVIFTDGSATTHPGPTGAGALIRKNRATSLPIKLAKTVPSSVTSYEGELEAIKISSEFAKENISDNTKNIHIFVDCKSAPMQSHNKAMKIVTT